MQRAGWSLFWALRSACDRTLGGTKRSETTRVSVRASTASISSQAGAEADRSSDSPRLDVIEHGRSTSCCA